MKQKETCGKLFEITIPDELFDNWMGDEFPKIQRKNREDMSTNVLICFKHCIWASPMPLLSLATEIATYSQENRKIHIDISSDNTSKSQYQFNRMRKFLSMSGLIDAFSLIPNVTVSFSCHDFSISYSESNLLSSPKEIAALRAYLERQNVELLYGDRVVVPATVCRLPEHGNKELNAQIRKIIAKALKEADSALFKFKTEARKFRDTTLQRLNQTLFELLENSAEHAYTDEQGYVGFFARIRQTPSNEAQNWRSKEHAGSPLLSQILKVGNQHQIEVFVVDVGCGLFANIDDWSEFELKNRKYPLRETFRVLFRKPLTRLNRNQEANSKLRGAATGLMHLDSILSHRNDRTRIFTGSECVCGPHPRPKKFNGTSSFQGGYEILEKSVTGTFFHIGLSPAEIPKLDPSWFVSDANENKHILDDVVSKLTRTKIRSFVNQVVDLRGANYFANIKDEVRKITKLKGGVVVRVNRVIEKNLINILLNSWLAGIFESQKKDSYLYLCDLGGYQAIDTAWIIEQFARRIKIANSQIPRRAEVFLITEDLCCAKFKCDMSYNKHFSAYEIRVRSLNIMENDISGRIVFVLNELRKNDSEKFWHRVSELQPRTGHSILIKNVLWENGKEPIPYYVNFPIVIQDSELARVVRRALRRILALFPNANDVALDQMVKAPLHDAKKWLVRPEKDLHHTVLVGSLTVSGSTIGRYRPLYDEKVVAIIDCLETSHYRAEVHNHNMPHLFTLLWDPQLKPVSPSEHPPKYKRSQNTAHIELITNPVERSKDSTNERFYEDVETDKLLKLGHWSYGGRHSLLEFNAVMAIEQSADSEYGAINWLSTEITKLCSDFSVVMTFPLHPLAYRLAHHVEVRINQAFEKSSTTLANLNILRVLPLSFAPRYARGISKFTPLVFEAACKLATDKPADRNVIAVYIDLGFLTNRTLRHSFRQLRSAGFEDIRAFGLVNRSSIPEPSTESAFEQSNEKDEHNHLLSNSVVPIPQTYWRWHVPTLGVSSHCPICNALPALAKLRRILDDAHMDLTPALNKMSNEWKARNISDFWEEYGIEPLVLNDDMLQIINNSLPIGQNSHTPLTSTTLTARLIEHIRLTGDIQLPLEIAIKVRDVCSDSSAEILATILMVTGGDMRKSDLFDYVTALVEVIFSLNQPSKNLEEKTRRDKLLGLVLLVVINQSSTCKLTVLNLIVDSLSKTLVILPALRVVLIALTTDSDDRTVVQKAFRRRCVPLVKNDLLYSNYQSLRHKKGNSNESWGNLIDAFARSENHHESSVFGETEDLIKNGESHTQIVEKLERISSLISQCDKYFLSRCFEIDKKETMSKVLEFIARVNRETFDVGPLREGLNSVFGSLRAKVHSSLIRYGSGARDYYLYQLFLPLIQTYAKNYSLDDSADIEWDERSTEMRLEEGIGEYMPRSNIVYKLFDEIFSNIASKSIPAPPPSFGNANITFIREARAWMWLDLTKRPPLDGITFAIANGINYQNNPKTYRPKVVGLEDAKICVKGEQFEFNDHKYFKVEITFPSLRKILERT